MIYHLLDFLLMPPLQNLYVEILTANIMAIGGENFARWSGHEGRAFMNEISSLIKETPKYSLTLFPMWGHSEKMAICEPGEAPHQQPNLLTLWSWTFMPPEL